MGNPAGWGVNTPDATWLLNCSQCITQTPSYDWPTLAPVQGVDNGACYKDGLLLVTLHPGDSWIALTLIRICWMLGILGLVVCRGVVQFITVFGTKDVLAQDPEKCTGEDIQQDHALLLNDGQQVTNDGLEDVYIYEGKKCDEEKTPTPSVSATDLTVTFGSGMTNVVWAEINLFDYKNVSQCGNVYTITWHDFPSEYSGEFVFIDMTFSRALTYGETIVIKVELLQVLRRIMIRFQWNGIFRRY